MISNSVIQNTIDGIKNIWKADICVVDTDTEIVATTFEETGIYEPIYVPFFDSPAQSQEVGGVQFVKVFEDDDVAYVVIVKGDVDDLYPIARMIAFQLGNLIVAYKEKYDKDNFIKNLLLDNMLTVDIYNRAKKIHISTRARRVVFVIRTGNVGEPGSYADDNEMWILRNIFATYHSRDFVTAVDTKDIILVKELRPKEGPETLEKIANTIVDMLSSEAMIRVRVAYGTIISDIKDVPRSYREALTALKISCVLNEENRIASYDSLGVGRMVFQMSESMCRLYLEDVLNGHAVSEFDEELISTVITLFNNNLNVSETSRQLFIHRNTLMYRFDKIQKMTGIDIRVFEDAVKFRIALMVSAYLDYLENEENE